MRKEKETMGWTRPYSGRNDAGIVLNQISQQVAEGGSEFLSRRKHQTDSWLFSLYPLGIVEVEPWQCPRGACGGGATAAPQKEVLPTVLPCIVDWAPGSEVVCMSLFTKTNNNNKTKKSFGEKEIVCSPTSWSCWSYLLKIVHFSKKISNPIKSLWIQFAGFYLWILKTCLEQPAPLKFLSMFSAPWKNICLANQWVVP